MRVWLMAGLLVAAIAAGGFVLTRDDDRPCAWESWSYTFGGPVTEEADSASTPEGALAWYLTQGEGRSKQIPHDPEDYTREQHPGRTTFTAGDVRLFAQDLSGTWAIDGGERTC